MIRPDQRRPSIVFVDYYIIDAVTTIDAVVVLAVIGLLMVWRNAISSSLVSLLFLLVQLLFIHGAQCIATLLACVLWVLTTILVGAYWNVWHPVSFFRVNSFGFVLNWIPFLVIDWGAERTTFEIFDLIVLPPFVFSLIVKCHSSSSSFEFIYIREIGNDTKPYRRRRLMCSIHLNDESDTVFLEPYLLIDLFALLCGSNSNEHKAKRNLCCK